MIRALFFVLIYFIALAPLRAEQNMGEFVSKTTVRIETNKGTGSGFYFKYDLNINATAPVVVTNRHVIEGSTTGVLLLNLTHQTSKTQTVLPLYLDKFASLWILHPDPSIDLAILPLGPIVQDLKSKGFTLKCSHFEEKDLISNEEIDELSPFDSVSTVGYPIGLFDIKNNLPIFRRGFFGSLPKVDFNGSPLFLVDQSIFPGSSGSPVLLADTIYKQHGELGFGERLKLIGIVCGVFNFDSRSKLIEVQNQTKATYAQNSIPTNLGVVIKARVLEEFEPILIGMVKSGK